jgi:hypothetical protein
MRPPTSTGTWDVPDGHDTSIGAAAIQRQLFIAMGAEQRLRLMAQMLDDAVRLVESSIDSAGLIDPRERRRAVFRRLYANDLPADTLDRVCVLL